MSVGPAGPPAVTFVPSNERERLFVAIAEVVAEAGLEQATPATVAARAGCAVEDFDRHFPDTRACLLAAFDATADQAFAAAADAFVSTPGSWAEAVHNALAALLTFLAGSAALTRMCTVEALATGPPALELRDTVLDRFAELLEPGYAASAEPPSSTVSEAVSGGLFEVVRAHAVERRVHELPAVLPQLTVIALSPFVGSEEAERVAAMQPGAR